MDENLKRYLPAFQAFVVALLLIISGAFINGLGLDYSTTAVEHAGSAMIVSGVLTVICSVIMGAFIKGGV